MELKRNRNDNRPEEERGKGKKRVNEWQSETFFEVRFFGYLYCQGLIDIAGRPCLKCYVQGQIKV